MEGRETRGRGGGGVGGLRRVNHLDADVQAAERRRPGEVLLSWRACRRRGDWWVIGG